MDHQDDDRPPKPRGSSNPARPFTPSYPVPYRASDASALRNTDSEPPSNNYAGEDFLFHLYRGSELLQDNCIEEAKEELERALSMQPRDPEGQALLGVVYFRLGLYPRAIEIYEELVRAFPREIAPRVNAALCYLKTGQPLMAREFLEEVIRREPEHKRAWGYLGLVYERLGDPAKAQSAFEQSGQTHLARRMQDLLAKTSAAQSEPPAGRAELRRAAADAVQELDDDPSPFERAATTGTQQPPLSGRWRAIELGRDEDPPPPRRLSQRPPASTDPPPADPPVPLQALAPVSPSRLPTATELGERSLVALPNSGVYLLGEEVAAAAVQEALWARVSSVCALLPRDEPFVVSPAHRRWRGRAGQEPLGGAAQTLALLEGKGHVLLSAAAGSCLVAVGLLDEYLYVRESHLVAFESTLRYENGRLVRSDGTQTPMVQISGSGFVLFEAKQAPRTLELHGEHAVTIEADRVLGWTGRLLPSPGRAEPSLAGLGSLVTFSGDGAIFAELG